MKKQIQRAALTILVCMSMLVHAEGGTPSAVQADAIREVTDTLWPGGIHNVVTYASPRSVRVAELGLIEAGVKGGPVFRVADEVRLFASKELTGQSPKARLWFNTREQAWWFHTGGEGSAADFVLQAGEVLVIVTRASTEPIAWKNPLR